MTLAEETVAFFMSLSLFFSPSDDITPQKIATNPPHVFIVPYQEFHQTFCGCPCGMGGVYIGELNVDGVKGKTILLAGVKQGNMFFGDSSQLEHELEHYKQDLKGEMNIGNMNDQQAKERRTELEKKAYDAQNRYNAYYGLPLLDTTLATESSVNWGSGKPECLNGVNPLPLNLRKTPVDLILEYQRPTLEQYRK